MNSWQVSITTEAVMIALGKTHFAEGEMLHNIHIGSQRAAR